MNKLLDEAAKVDADYVYVKSIEKTNKDFFFDLCILMATLSQEKCIDFKIKLH